MNWFAAFRTSRLRSGSVCMSSRTMTNMRPSKRSLIVTSGSMAGRSSNTRSARSMGMSTIVNISTFCGLPSSNTSKSSAVRLRTTLPLLSVTIASTST